MSNPESTVTKAFYEISPQFGLSVEKANYFFDLGLYGEAGFVLSELLKSEPDNTAAQELLERIDLGKTALNPESYPSQSHTTTLLFGVHDVQIVEQVLTSLSASSQLPRNVIILIDAGKSDGQRLGHFEKACNDAINKKNLWNSVTLLRGSLSDSGETYVDLFSTVSEVYYAAGTILPRELPQQCLKRSV